MKHLSFFACLLLLTASGAYAQKIEWGAEAGLNISGAFVKDPGGDPSGSPLPGFQLGAFGSLPLSSHLSAGVRLLLSNEGYEPDIYDTKSKIHVTFLKLPLNLLFTNGGKWFYGAGPYFAFGLGGHYTWQEGNKVTIDFGNDANKDELKRMDFGADLVAGYHFNDKIFLRAAFDVGLVDYLTPGSTESSSAHSFSFGITAAYLLKK